MNSSNSFPLKWPTGRPRTEKYRRKAAAFKTSMARSRDNMLSELRRLGASQVVISSNVETYMRGGQEIPYADQSKQHEDPGVAVYYMWKGEQYCLSCDKYNSVMDNMQAINKTVEAIRGIERWGTGEMMKAAFQGFKELPEPPHTNQKDWWQVMNYQQKPGNAVWDWAGVETQYKSLAKKLHPDMPGGSTAAFQELQSAFENAKRYYGR
jgi:hypothetical protein